MSIFEEMRQIDMAIAKHRGWWVYHYNKDYEANCYYLLVDKEFDAVAFDKDMGHRKTLEEALKDVPQITWSTGYAIDLLEEADVFYVIRRVSDYEYEVTLAKSQRARDRITVSAERMPLAICQAYLKYFQVDVQDVELKVD